MTDPVLAAAKAAARQLALAQRVGLDPALGARLAAVVLAGCMPPEGAVVSGFWPIGDEIDVRPLLQALHARGHVVGLPETLKRGLPLVFRRWRDGEFLHAGRFGTSHPLGETIVPDFILVPLLAFDRRGNRLGYGAGYYDRTLAGLSGAFRLGCAYAAQEIAEVPAGSFDQRLDAIATENGIIRVGGGRPPVTEY
ncbi:MAG: 5-formyltetrahydrofolate cyclo-ligase [Acidiphilium sp.]|nr:5-formyltetrahydrofolate cyclo-ligase [Acidiphilium sp.]MDD4936762.1 5-formyltetrahydrofolate cyclo-ligase [Acidiphilium sp.]